MALNSSTSSLSSSTGATRGSKKKSAKRDKELASSSSSVKADTPTSRKRASDSNDTSKAATKKKKAYQAEIQEVMQSFGDCKSSNTEAVEVIESTVRQYILELIHKATLIAQRKGSRMAIEDIMFVLRRDPHKIKRLKEFLNWKARRKILRAELPLPIAIDTPASESLTSSSTNINNATSTTPSSTPVPIASVQSPVSSSSSATVQSTPPLASTSAAPSPTSATSLTSSTSNLKTSLPNISLTSSTTSIPKKKKVKLPWDFMQSLRTYGSNDSDDSDSDEEIKDIEYIEYADNKQTCFTHKKAKKFRDWADCSITNEIKVNDDVLEVIGFLAWEAVGLITKTALFVKHETEDVPPSRSSKSKSKQAARKSSKKSKLKSSSSSISSPASNTSPPPSSSPSNPATSTSPTSSSAPDDSNKDVVPMVVETPQSPSATPVTTSSSPSTTGTSTESGSFAVPQSQTTTKPIELAKKRLQVVNSTTSGLFAANLLILPDNRYYDLMEVYPQSQTPILVAHVREALRRLRPLNHSLLDASYFSGRSFLFS